jgi:hypothetical protein
MLGQAKHYLRGKNQNMLNQTRLKETTYVKKKSLKIPKGGNQNP